MSTKYIGVEALRLLLPKLRQQHRDRGDTIRVLPCDSMPTELYVQLVDFILADNEYYFEIGPIKTVHREQASEVSAALSRLFTTEFKHVKWTIGLWTIQDAFLGLILSSYLGSSRKSNNHYYPKPTVESEVSMVELLTDAMIVRVNTMSVHHACPGHPNLTKLLSGHDRKIRMLVTCSALGNQWLSEVTGSKIYVDGVTKTPLPFVAVCPRMWRFDIAEWKDGKEIPAMLQRMSVAYPALEKLYIDDVVGWKAADYLDVVQFVPKHILYLKLSSEDALPEQDPGIRQKVMDTFRACAEVHIHMKNLVPREEYQDVRQELTVEREAAMMEVL